MKFDSPNQIRLLKHVVFRNINTNRIFTICLFLILISVWKRILMHQKHHFSFMERIVCSLYVGKRRLIRLAFCFIIYMSYNVAFYSILHVNVLKRRFSVLLTAWVQDGLLLL